MNAMPAWIWIFFTIAGGLFALKIVYIICTALVLPITQGALYVSTSRVRVAAFIDAVPMKAGQLLVDIGCGDGRVLRMARKRYDVKTVGYEVNLLAYIKARLLCLGDRGIKIIGKIFGRKIWLWQTLCSVIFIRMLCNDCPKSFSRILSRERSWHRVISPYPGFHPAMS